MPIAISPGTMNTSYCTPPISLMRPPRERPKTTMNSALERTGARIVCVHSFSTRSTSRPESAIRPRRLAMSSDTRLTLARGRGRNSRPGVGRARAGEHDERDGEEVDGSERLLEHDEAGQRGDRRLERHQHPEHARGDAPQRLELE